MVGATPVTSGFVNVTPAPFADGVPESAKVKVPAVFTTFTLVVASIEMNFT